VREAGFLTVGIEYIERTVSVLSHRVPLRAQALTV
jgi:hypothetical protein